MKKQINRGKKFIGMATTMAGGYRAMYRVGAFKAPPREILPRYIQIFCHKIMVTLDMEVVQVETVPQSHALWASNHLSWMDIPVVGSVSPAFFLAKSEIGEWPIFGPLMKASGHLLIKRGSGDAGAVTDQLTGFLKQGHSIVLFPEGTTTDGKQIKKVHGKLLKSAVDASTPIQPVVVCYANKDGSLSDAVPYHGKLTMKQSIKKVMDSKDVTAYILPLEEIDTSCGDIEKLTSILQKRLEDGLVELHRRVKNKQTKPMLHKQDPTEKSEVKAAA